jgi:hypothetical protein
LSDCQIRQARALDQVGEAWKAIEASSPSADVVAAYASVANGHYDDPITGLLDSVRRGLAFLDIALQGGGSTTVPQVDLIEHVCELEKRVQAAHDLFVHFVAALETKATAEVDDAS